MTSTEVDVEARRAKYSPSNDYLLLMLRHEKQNILQAMTTAEIDVVALRTEYSPSNDYLSN